MATIRKLVCPKCKKYWATLDFSLYPGISAKHLKVVAGSRYKAKDGESVKCSFCGYLYLTTDIVLAGASMEYNGKLEPGQEVIV